MQSELEDDSAGRDDRQQRLSRFEHAAGAIHPIGSVAKIRVIEDIGDFDEHEQSSLRPVERPIGANVEPRIRRQT